MAAEPLVQDPIAFAWGPDGKLWVVEMGDYPLGIDGKGKPGGRVKFLEDRPRATAITTRRPSSSTTSASRPACMPWRKGVLVTCAPDIFYAEDTDGDGKADKKEVLLHRLQRGQSAAPRQRPGLGARQLDLLRQRRQRRPGQVGEDRQGGRPQRPRLPHPARHRRHRPPDGPDAVRPQPRRLGQLVRRQQQQPDVPLRPGRPLPPPQPAPAAARPAGAGVGDARRRPRSIPSAARCRASTTRDAANHFTSACSAIVYRDDLFGPAFANNTFVSEPVHNLVHREIMTANGVTFTSRRAADEQSRSSWPRATTGSGRR